MSKVEVKAGKADTAALLEQGRLKIDPKTGKIKERKSPVIGTFKARIYNPQTGLYELTNLPLEGGHVCGEWPEGTPSVWRFVLCKTGKNPCEEYYDLRLQDAERVAIGGKVAHIDIDDLTSHELAEYIDWLNEEKLVDPIREELHKGVRQVRKYQEGFEGKAEEVSLVEEKKAKEKKSTKAKKEEPVEEEEDSEE